MDKVVIDTNIIIRYLTGDNPQLCNKATQIIRDAYQGKIKILINTVTLAESFFVLTSSVYQLSPSDAANLLIEFITLKGIYLEKRKIIEQTLQFIRDRQYLSFVDIYNLFYAILKKAKLITFDKKLLKTYKNYL